ncbi:hypothetical protein EDD11_004102 [Mortierella claussenii]|nr:hypothetical protein EDD11_004102 [Mortierella claussenii]
MAYAPVIYVLGSSYKTLFRHFSHLELFESKQKYGCPVRTARHPGLIAYIQQIVGSIRTELQKDSIHRICVVTLDSTGQAMDRFVFEMSIFRPFQDQILLLRPPTSLPSNKIDKGKGKAMDDPTRPNNESEERDDDDDDDNDDNDDDDDDDDEPLYRTSLQNRLAGDRSSPGPRLGAMMTMTTNVETLLRAMLLKISICDSYLKPLSDEQDYSFTVVLEMKAPGPGPETKKNIARLDLDARAMALMALLVESLARLSLVTHKSYCGE